DRSLAPERLSAMRVGPVGPSALARMLRRKLGWSPAWPRVLRIAELSGGNPFYALEIARARGSVRSAGALDEPLPERLTDLVRTPRSRWRSRPPRSGRGGEGRPTRPPICCARPAGSPRPRTPSLWPSGASRLVG